MPDRPPRGRHPVEGRGHVRAHALAIAIDERAAVAAAAGHRGRASGGRARGAGFRHRGGLDPARAGAEIEAADDDRFYLDRSEGRQIRKGDAKPGGLTPLALAERRSRRSSPAPDRRACRCGGGSPPRSEAPAARAGAAGRRASSAQPRSPPGRRPAGPDPCPSRRRRSRPGPARRRGGRGLLPAPATAPARLPPAIA